ncbi:hypothetical protein E1265_36615 [Streptomyces sp. 8K308]|uniref:hypothetical protein n=1 Tax=Streptomyces sp. 8K308 TaxID=2530388 RepID=UPI0010450DE4|nr:hypothetical protein [Streptomyces sp. 8K308]TDC03135.1 hypothetical protein E1265_36615 [Streptomyces sp. 8K308]
MSNPDGIPAERIPDGVDILHLDDISEAWKHVAPPPADGAPIDVTGLDQAAVLAALYNASKLLGLGFLNPLSQNPMSVDEAREYLDSLPTERYPDGPSRYVDYCRGRVVKVWIGPGHLDPTLYDRDNGTGAAANAIAELRRAKETNS